MSEQHSLKLASRLEAVEVAQDFIGRIAAMYGLSEDGIHHCYLSVDEVITNIVEHGYEFVETPDAIEIVLVQDAGSLIIEIIDGAPLFNPLMHPEPDPTLPLWERIEDGGWGIHFVRKFMDGAVYHSTGGKNHLRMTKRLTV
jgi:anti-sigma regulatory factor (Ser/Thr protein kinase)